MPRIEIERDSAKMRIFIHCARPGIIVGKGGSEIEKLQKTLSDMVGKPVSVSIVEVRSPDLNAKWVLPRTSPASSKGAFPPPGP